MLAFISQGNLIKTIASGHTLTHDGITVSPAFDGWVYDNLSLIKVAAADPVPNDMGVISTSVEMVEGKPKYVHSLESLPIPVIPTIEDIRADMPKLSMVDFRRKLRGIKVVEHIVHHPEYEVEDPETGEVTLVQPEPTSYLDGIYEEDILEKIAFISDKDLAAEARDYFLYAQYIERINPWVEVLGSMFGLTPEEIDTFWIEE